MAVAQDRSVWRASGEACAQQWMFFVLYDDDDEQKPNLQFIAISLDSIKPNITFEAVSKTHCIPINYADIDLVLIYEGNFLLIWNNE